MPNNATGKYILNANGQPVEETDLITWARWMEKGDRIVARTEIVRPPADTVRVSTVFLGLDHSFGSGAPLLYETMIFGGEHNDYTDRYSTREEAEAGHAKAVAIAKGEISES